MVSFSTSFSLPRNAQHLNPSIGHKLWGFTKSFPMFAGDCASGHRKSHSEALPEIKSDLTDTCSQMILQLHDVYDPNKINVKIKIVSGSPCGAVAAESKKAQANWVVLDKNRALLTNPMCSLWS